MTKFDKIVYAVLGVVILSIAIVGFVTSDLDGKIGVFTIIIYFSLYAIIPLMMSILAIIENRVFYSNSFSGISLLVMGICKAISLVCLIVFSSLMITKFAGFTVLQQLLKFDIFASSQYQKLVNWFLQYSKSFQMMNFHRSLSGLISILPEPDSIFFYVISVISLIIFIIGFALGTTDNRKKFVGSFIDNFVFGVGYLLCLHMFVHMIVSALIGIIPAIFIMFMIFSGIESQKEVSNKVGVEEIEYTSSSFPSYLSSSSDNTKTIYFVSSSYTDRATYRDENGNYVDIVKRDGNYYDSSNRDRYY